MNRLNTLPPALKTKAIEETEIVSKEIARRFCQVVRSTSTSPSVENRQVPQTVFSASTIQKSTSASSLLSSRHISDPTRQRAHSYHSLVSPTNSSSPLVDAKPLPPKRNVSFAPMASVVLIPTVAEYVHAGLKPLLWWDKYEMQEFKQNALREVQSLMEIYGIAHVKEAFARMNRSDDYPVQSLQQPAAVEDSNVHHKKSFDGNNLPTLESSVEEELLAVSIEQESHDRDANHRFEPPAGHYLPSEQLSAQFRQLPQMKRSQTIIENLHALQLNEPAATSLTIT